MAVINALFPLSLVIAGVMVVWLLREPITRAIPSVRHVKVAGVELELAGKALVDHRREQLKDPWLAEGLVERAAGLRERLTDFRILWVDDSPENNQIERRFLRRAGATVVNALSTEEGLQELRRDDIDVVITDFRRDGKRDAGIEFAALVFDKGHRQPILAYIGSVNPDRPTPAHIEMVTDHPDVLLARVLDIARDRSR
ncbi:hypothetical protein H9657_01865 [Cellulomonas sp. Sa3CUA2]|uniref:Response regulatory domain-containing protein n=1 Tax=Cellulomonas avistercoris TaxID=2762242 RepID=A0ABR8Q9B6_9CELL|nr:hypothetical protein [Cellulomonas avistercoris]MBD7917028.1 hypothetical protein [Cellulomonas avistercoris]